MFLRSQLQVARNHRNLCCLHLLWFGTNSTILKPKFWWKQFLQRWATGPVGKGSVQPCEGSSSRQPQQRLRLWRQGRRAGRDGRERWRTSESPSCVCVPEGEAGKCRLMLEKWPYTIIKMIHKHSSHFQLSFLYVKKGSSLITQEIVEKLFFVWHLYDQNNTWESRWLSFWELLVSFLGF